MIGVIGCGNMGAALVKQLAAAGEKLVIWDLELTHSEALRADSVSPVQSRMEVIDRCAIIVICVPAYEHVASNLEDATLAGKTIVNLTTGTPEEAEALLPKVEAAGGGYLDGSILVRPDEVGAADSTMLVSGNRKLWESARPHLATLAGDFRHVSEQIGAANALELSVYGSYGLVSAVGLVEGIIYARTAGIGEEDYIAVLKTTTPTAAALAREGFASLGSGDFAAPGANLDIYLHAAETFLASFASRGQNAEMLKFAAEQFRRGVDAGRGDEGLFALSLY